MEMTTLGRTGLEVSRLGVGLVEIGVELGWPDEAQAARVLNTALDSGINFLDTAECYGIAEEVIGRNIAHRRNEYVLATKAGHVRHGYVGAPWTGKTVADSIDRSLKRLKTDYVDLVQLHAFDLDSPAPDDTIEALLRAKEAGKTRFAGYSADNEHARWAIESGYFDTLQCAFSLLDQHPRTKTFPLAEEHGVGIIVKRPIGNAMWRASHVPEGRPTEEGIAFMLLERAQAMADLGPIEDEPDDRILTSLGFVMAHPEVDTAILGTGNPDHMRSNIDMLENRMPIPESVVDELHRRYGKLGADWISVD